jgi:dienelactone hydrolase
LDYGLDALAIGDSGQAPFVALKAYVEGHLQHSEEFFDQGPPPKCEIRQNVLNFKSAVHTEDERNNTVWCRLFASPGSKRAVILLPYWNAPCSSLARLARGLARGGVTTLQVSLPYHDERRPAHEPIAGKMVSANIGRTIRSSRQAVLDARSAISWLQEQGHTRIGVVGVSLGSSIASIVAAHDARVCASGFLLMADDFAEVVWTGRATRHIRAALEGNLSLEQLKQVWSVISPGRYVNKPQARRVPTLVIAGRHDAVFQPELTRRIVDAYRRYDVPFGHQTLPCGHYTLASFPFSVWAFAALLSFLRRRL